MSATLPKDMVDHLNVGPGDSMLAIQTEDGILLTPYDPDFEDSTRSPSALSSQPLISTLIESSQCRQ